MKVLQNMSFRAKIGGSFGVILVFVLLLSLLIFRILGITTMAMSCLNNVNGVLNSVEEINASARNYFIQGDIRHLEDIQESRKDYTRYSTEAAALLRHPENRQKLQAITNEMDRCLALIDELSITGAEARVISEKLLPGGQHITMLMRQLMMEQFLPHRQAGTTEEQARWAKLETSFHTDIIEPSMAMRMAMIWFGWNITEETTKSCQQTLGAARAGLARWEHTMDTAPDLAVACRPLVEAYQAYIEVCASYIPVHNTEFAQYQEIRGIGESIFADSMETRETSSAKVITAVNKTKTIALIAFLVVLAVGLFLGIAIARIMSRDMHKGVDFITQVAEGDLTARVDIDQRDEIGILAGAMQGMVDTLHETVNSVRETSTTVTEASREVTSTAEQVSQGSTEQAAAVEEIAATIEEMSSTIKLTADNAEDGRSKARSTMELVGTNADRSRHMAEAMDDITASSTRIKDIIGTVNEVAFQTNLLALNAAVEAARAGEHGKGFAVVAEEVRNLAQRSADASHQIRDLIEDMLNKISSGSTIVTATADGMSDITQSTEQLAQSMEEIAAASAEQSTGIDELNRAIAQVDSSTQSNVATVEELAATADTMQAQARELMALMDHFNTRDGAASPLPNPTTPPLPASAPAPATARVEGFEEF